MMLVGLVTTLQAQGIGDPCATAGTAGCPDGGYCDTRGGLNLCVDFDDPAAWPCDPSSLTSCTCDRNGDGSDCPIFEASTTCGTNVLVICGNNGRCSNSSGANSSDQCSDGNQCTDDTGLTCQPTQGGSSFWCAPSTNNEPLGTPCDLDDNFCSTADTCDGSGTCQAGGPLMCDDGLFCTGDEGCDPATGCVAGTPPCTGPNEVCDEDGDFCDSSLPVEIASLTALYTGSAIVLQWKTLLETDNIGFGIEVGQDSLSFAEVGFVAGQGTSLVEHNYRYEFAPLYSGVHYIRLRQVDLDGTLSYSLVLTLVPEVPNMLSLEQAYPNPFKLSTQITFRVEQDMPAKLTLYNACGKQVIILFDDHVKAGVSHRVAIAGTQLASGVYFYQLTTPYGSVVRKITRIR